MNPATLDLRVTVLDNWDEVTLHLPSATQVVELKRAALSRAGIRGLPADYVVKYKGAELAEAGRTLADSGVAPNSALLVLRRRRVPVR